MSDCILNNPLLSDSPSAWERLIESIGPASLLVVIDSRMSAALRSITTAEDILQEALLHAWRDRERCEWRGLRAFRSWLLTIIDHRIQNAANQNATIKRGGGAATISLAGAGEAGATTGADFVIAAGSTTPSRVAIFREQAAAMRTALESLPADQREVVHLRLFEQLSLEAIADRLGLTVAAVRHRFGRGAERYQSELRALFESRSIPALNKCSALENPEPSP